MTYTYCQLKNPEICVLILLQAHEFDECRFDVAVNDCLWYLRCRNAEGRQQWMDTLEFHKVCSDLGDVIENAVY